jgi:hypothetical protein
MASGAILCVEGKAIASLVAIGWVAAIAFYGFYNKNCPST